MANQIQKLIPSISFSGAGFLGCYHIGVATCLLKHGYLLPPGDIPTSIKSAPVLLGASAGALVCTSIAAGVNGEDAMDIIYKLNRATKEEGGLLDNFQPGFSLVDQVEKYLFPAIHKALDGDEELLQRRIRNEHGRSLLRIALSNKHDIRLTTSIEKAYRFTDTYRDIDDICAAAILSSFIPGLTGPIQGAKCTENLAVGRAWERMKEMIELGYVRDGASEDVVDTSDIRIYDKTEDFNGDAPSKITKRSQEGSVSKESYWDGGLSNMWPILNTETLVVSPLNGDFSPNPYIAPLVNESEESSPRVLTLNDRTKVGLNTKNIKSAWKMCVTSEDSFIEERFTNGYDDTCRYLNRNNLKRVFSR